MSPAIFLHDWYSLLTRLGLFLPPSLGQSRFTQSRGWKPRSLSVILLFCGLHPEVLVSSNQLYPPNTWQVILPKCLWHFSYPAQVKNITNEHWVESPISQSEHSIQKGSEPAGWENMFAFFAKHGFGTFSSTWNNLRDFYRRGSKQKHVE